MLQSDSEISRPDPGAGAERYFSLIFGALLLLLATSLCAWGVRLTVAGLAVGSWPPGLGQLLLPIGLTVLAIGFGAWRLLRMALPARLGGLSLGAAVLATFAIAAVIGALL